MRIAHEAPLSLMKYVKQATDYDYALASLFKEVDGYLEYFKQAKTEGRKVLLDNGVFEEGIAMASGYYAAYIQELQPDEYVVPDVLEDALKTVKSFASWLEVYRDLPGMRIGVVQGKTLQEFVECYKYMSAYADKIAISFDYSFYTEELFPSAPENKWVKYGLGRINTINYLHMIGLLNTSKPHHLLGISLPAELSHYPQGGAYECIDTVDTSNPVVYAILKGRYPKHLVQVVTKETTKMKDLITTPYSDKLVVDTITNITQFRLQNTL